MKSNDILDEDDHKWADLIELISLYDSMIFITRGAWPWYREWATNKDFLWL